MSRIALPRVFAGATRAPKPPADLAECADTWRQTGFVLGDEVEHVVAGLRLEGEHATAAAGSRFRTPAVASAMGPWSRSWLARLQALHAMEWGDYSSAVLLVRGAADFLAAACSLLESGGAEWSEWLAGGGVQLAPAEHATEFRLHPFRSAETLARRPGLGEVYRAASDLSLPHLGATALVTASESNPERYAATFGDRDFHVGMAELVLGWLLQLGMEAWQAVRDAGDRLPPPPEGVERWVADAQRMLARADRCRMERVEHGGEPRMLVVNWRREPRSAPKRILL
ncbi:hypothetical protein [Tepidiforma sp.]|uniref:hypothetical protein n=1 Tax=Tepidiforma sp. TaxID=2682230 RepID=UPI002ADD9E4B|nr:hypothetical protein [Tepidiforma sp.]